MFTEEQEKVIQTRIATELENNKPEITNASAQSFLKNAGIGVFASEGDYHRDIVDTISKISRERIDNPNPLERSIIDFKSNLAGEVLTPVDQDLKAITGMEKEEGEKTRAYLKRVLPLIMKSEGVDEAEFNALKSKLTSRNTEYGNLEKELSTLKSDIVNGEKEQLISKGIPSNLDYSADELELMLGGIKSNINSAFEFQKDDKGWKVVNKGTGEPELNAEGHRKPIDKVINDFVSKMATLKFKEGSINGAQTPSSIEMSKEQSSHLESEWEKQIAERGFIGHEKKAFEIRHKLGLPISERVKERWPEFK